MKKLIRIAAPVTMTALLSACAAPGTGPATLENLGPGELAEVQKQVAERLVNKGPDGGPSPIEEMVKDVLSKPGPGGVQQQALLEALKQDEMQMALLEALGNLGGDDFIRREIFHFNLGGADSGIESQVRDKIRRIFNRAKDKAGTENPGLTIRQPDPKVDVWHVENLAGLTNDDKALIRRIRGEIEAIPGLGDDQIQTPIREDEGGRKAAIPKDRTTIFSVATGPVEASYECPKTAPIFHRLYGDEEAEGRNVVLSIYDGEKWGKDQNSPVYEERRSISDTGEGCKFDDPGVRYHYVMARLENPAVVQYRQIDVVRNKPIPSPDKYSVGKPACPPDNWDDGIRREFVNNERLPELTEADCDLR